MNIVAQALKGNVPDTPFIRIENPDGSVYFEGKEELIWLNKKLLNAKCIIMSGLDGLICRLTEPLT